MEYFVQGPDSYFLMNFSLSTKLWNNAIHFFLFLQHWSSYKQSMYRSPSCCMSVQKFMQIFQNIMLINTRIKKTLWTFIAWFRVLKIIYLYWLTITTKIPCQFDVWIVLIHGLNIPFTYLVETSKLSLKYEQIMKPETFLGCFIAIKCIC